MSPAPNAVSTTRFFRVMFWVYWRSLLARLQGIRQKSRLLLFVLGIFFAGYLCAGYWIFHWGLSALFRFPLIGAMLSQRILFLMFGFFFVMLIFSNFIIGYSTLFKNRETAWLLTLPIRHRNVYRWKFVESLAVSSWALIFLSAPLLAAFGKVHSAPWLFYGAVTLACLPFVVIPALLGSWGILLLVRGLATSWAKSALFAIAAGTVIWLVLGLRPVAEAEPTGRHEVMIFDQLLRHTRTSVNPALPSAWLAQSVLSWSAGLYREGGFFFLVLLSNALMGLLVGFEVGGRFFYGSWSAATSNRAATFHRRAEKKRARTVDRSPIAFLLRVLPISRPVAALALKDIRIFWREPAQWTQFMIFFGLLCIYVLNLRNVGFAQQSEFWQTMISHLNLAASALTVSTLTTRFVFPQFSLEGRRLWIIGLAPVGLKKVLLQKLGLSCAVSSGITVSLMLTSARMLHLPPNEMFFFAAAIGLISISLCSLAVGLGTLFPNLKEENPSKIVSGFGGTLCLIISFCYITLFVALAAVPALRRVTYLRFSISESTAIALALVLSALISVFPMLAAIRRVKNLEF